METERAGLGENVSIIKEAIKFDLEMQNEALVFNNRMPLFGIDKWFYVLKSLKPKELKRLIRNISSVNYGRHILTSVFPKYENPEEFHSTEVEICVSEHPTQVLGSDDEERMIQEGVNMGFERVYIEWGFNNEAVRRGIDLEWSFFEKPPNSQESSASLKLLP